MFLSSDDPRDIPNYERAFSQRPEVYEAWLGLNGTIKAGMDPRRYELVSIAVARVLRSSYCSLAHASRALAGELATVDELTDSTGLPPADQAVVAFAQRIARDASAIGEADVDALRAHGLGDQEIFDVVAAATARCFFAKTLDAVGAQADATFAAMEPTALRDALTVGRPIAEADAPSRLR
ncbi:MAG TPA: carboxymuconolactone decarboxylase family protein [Baekduia sp.]|uniref:carboxymuconolactone decarboxylase family protein n=1 Tax=Baekduia sp. TaxID=2600305 RepID=UPI002D79B2C5|nr:carboxymuconolactone decarboxylase family protein [Baekduia sp.]HET6507451.1 carboxymuconolactone decarboxylase family protein [Baekduia sp.]